MADFTVRFLLSNIVISMITGILLAARHLLRKSLTSRARYHLWFLLLGAMAVPFLPLQPFRMAQIFPWLSTRKAASASPDGTVPGEAAGLAASGNLSWMNDFSVSVSSRTPSPVGFLLCALWFAGILAMLVLLVRSALRLRNLQKSALPLQSPAAWTVYRNCIVEMKITRDIPVYSTVFLKSPAITGIFRPRIYLPTHLISDFHAEELRYMLLHELQHYKHRDAYANVWMNLAQIFYWFNPFVWHALKEMRNDREIACDTAVLQMLHSGDYESYGNTLINYAEKISLTAFPFAAGLGGSMEQMKKRILNIAGYSPVSFRGKMKSLAFFACIALLLSCFLPALSTGAAVSDLYAFTESENQVVYADYSSYFGENEGCFVLYDEAGGSWLIYNREASLTRIPPTSTYKIYLALHALENGIITQDNSLLSWNGMSYPYDTWNGDQTLESAMANSVNWYFQTLDQQMGLESARNFIREIGYGNQLADGDTSSYWLDSSLKISPVEQVELLRKLHDGTLPASPENAGVVQNAIRLSVTENGTLYGKTGTESVNGKNTSGWFIGYIERGNSTYYFATNIRQDDYATGTAATGLTLRILADLGIWAP